MKRIMVNWLCLWQYFCHNLGFCPSRLDLQKVDSCECNNLRRVEVVVKVNMAMIFMVNTMVVRNTFRVAVDSLVAFFLRAARSYPPPYLAKIPSFHIYSAGTYERLWKI